MCARKRHDKEHKSKNYEDDSNMTISSFKQQYTGCLKLFQTTLGHRNREETINVNEFNIFNNKYSPSFKTIVEEFIMPDEPIAIQCYLVGIFLDQMSAKVGT